MRVARGGQSSGVPVGVSRGCVPQCPCREPWFYHGEGVWGPRQPKESLCCFVPAVKHGLVSRRCGVDGQWVTVNGSQPWRDYSQCEEEMESTMEEVGAVTRAGAPQGARWVLLSRAQRSGACVQEGARRLMVSFKVLYTVGYSLSLLTLVSALLVLTVFR